MSENSTIEAIRAQLKVFPRGQRRELDDRVGEERRSGRDLER